VVLVAGVSVKEIEKRWERVWERCRWWENKGRMKYNECKTRVMFIENYGRIRPPVVRLGDERVECSECIDLLRIRLDRKGMFIEHAKYVRERMAEVASKLTGLCRNKCRMDKEKVRAIAERVAARAVLYGSQIWGVRANDSRVKRHLGAAERKFLLASVRCYRTVATETLRVVNGTPPWYLAAAAAAKFRDESVRVRVRDRATEEDRRYPGWKIWTEMEEIATEGIKVVWVDAGVHEGWTGVGVWSKCGIINSFWENRDRDSLCAELLGIGEAVKVIGRMGRGDYRIHTDCLAAVDLLGKPSLHRVVERVRNRVAGLACKGFRVAIEWKGRENEGIAKADGLATRAKWEGELRRWGGIRLWDRKGIKREMSEWIRSEWQSSWDTSIKGREVYQLCKEVGMDRLPLSFRGTQLLTGHGYLAAYLKRMGLKQDGMCECGRGEEDSRHVREECEAGGRREIRELMGQRGIIWGNLKLRVNGKTNGEDVNRVNEWGESALMEEEEVEETGEGGTV